MNCIVQFMLVNSTPSIQDCSNFSGVKVAYCMLLAYFVNTIQVIVFKQWQAWAPAEGGKRGHLPPPWKFKNMGAPQE